MITPVTESVSELFHDARNQWRQIGTEYYQTDERDGIVIEIRRLERTTTT